MIHISQCVEEDWYGYSENDNGTSWESRREQERIFDSYGDTCPHFGGLGGGQTNSARICPAVDRVSDEVWEADKEIRIGLIVLIHAKGIEIGIYTTDFEDEFISLTDIAKYRNDDDPQLVIQNWMRNRNTIEFLALWEELHNQKFNRVQFDTVKNEAGLNRLQNKDFLNRLCVIFH